MSKKKSKLLANKKGKHLAFDFPISAISCKISSRIKGYESKYPSRMNSSLKFVSFLTLDLIMNDEWKKFEESRSLKSIFQEKCHLEFGLI